MSRHQRSNWVGLVQIESAIDLVGIRYQENSMMMLKMMMMSMKKMMMSMVENKISPCEYLHICPLQVQLF